MGSRIPRQLARGKEECCWGKSINHWGQMVCVIARNGIPLVAVDF
jgi:hypothetical protein